MGMCYPDDLEIFKALISTIKEISKYNEYNLTNENCIEIADKMWADYDYLGQCVKYATKYYENSKL